MSTQDLPDMYALVPMYNFYITAILHNPVIFNICFSTATSRHSTSFENKQMVAMPLPEQYLRW